LLHGILLGREDRSPTFSTHKSGKLVSAFGH
jgi:hypothetical protein